MLESQRQLRPQVLAHHAVLDRVEQARQHRPAVVCYRKPESSLGLVATAVGLDGKLRDVVGERLGIGLHGRSPVGWGYAPRGRRGIVGERLGIGLHGRSPLG